ncbi:MAG TPA: NAD(P)/FAD-dependent oxidoreductase [Stellaceae bacterium]|nr:NAD(P)/FAD-dependent oxidoreductase [Stellaceae bacterium]
MNEHVEIVIAGAGVVGLAIARELALAGREVMVLEAADAIGTVTSSRNSEVIHAGLYYSPGSLKARFCVEGRDRLYDYCRRLDVPHRRLGKLLVAADAADLAALEKVEARARANGVDDLRWLSGQEAKALEPELACIGALFSPSTGIIDSHALMLAYQGEAEAAGAMIVCLAPVEHAAMRPSGGFTLHIGGAEPMDLDCDCLINSAGLDAVALASRIEGLAPDRLPEAYLCKGSYYTLAGRAPFRHLIYPAPEHAGLGVHLTLDLGGQARFGPDVEWTDHIDYTVDPARARGFYAAIRRYWPGLPDGALAPGYSGMRPKISGPDETAADFRIDGPEATGIAGLVNLFGIESPGLTASPAIARYVATLIG